MTRADIKIGDFVVFYFLNTIAPRNRAIIKVTNFLTGNDFLGEVISSDIAYKDFKMFSFSYVNDTETKILHQLPQDQQKKCFSILEI